MKPFIILILATVLLTACETKDEAPIAPDKMKLILTDIHFAEAYSTFVNDSFHVSRNKNMDSLAAYYNDILAHHKISSDLFMKSIDWYKQHPADLDSIYTRMLPELGTLESITP